MLRYVQYMMKERERVSKKGKAGCFTDDGFAIGLAYTLSVLKLNGRFDSLHWFDSLNDEFSAQLQKLQQAQPDSRNREEQAALSLRHRKLKSKERESDLLYYAFNGARIFFRKD